MDTCQPSVALKSIGVSNPDHGAYGQLWLDVMDAYRFVPLLVLVVTPSCFYFQGEARVRSAFSRLVCAPLHQKHTPRVNECVWGVSNAAAHLCKQTENPGDLWKVG